MRKKLKDFKTRLNNLKSIDSKKKKKVSDFKNFGAFFKTGIELVSPIIVALVIGFFFDNYFGTKPIFLLIFLFFGFAAGIMNVYRSVKNLGFEVGFKKKNDKLH